MASPPLESKARVTLELFFVCLGENICEQVTLNSCNPQFEKLANLMSCLGDLQILAKQTFMFFNHLAEISSEEKYFSPLV